ncbi:MAG: hypothetical protein ACOYVF_09580 [Candidatus Zixiibacteriota bacterium]
MKKCVLVVAVLTLVMLSVSSATAGKIGFGVRGGYSSNPDQVVFGAQAMFGKFMKVARFVPSFDFGTGDNITTYTFNGDFRLTMKIPNSSLSLYGAAGPTVIYWDADKGGTDTEIGATLTGGVAFPMGGKGQYNLEARFGIGDVPDFKIMFGIMFGGI